MIFAENPKTIRVMFTPFRDGLQSSFGGKVRLADILPAMEFSAKEAGFKAFFPVEQIFLGYKDAELAWREETQSFAGILLKGAGIHYPVGFPFEVGCRIIDKFVLSFVRLPPPDSLT